METPLGPMLLGATDGGVCLLDFADRAGIETQLGRVRKRFGGSLVPGTNEPVESLTRELEAYFAGHLRAFRTPLATGGTPFQERAWEALRAIPYGETRSYGEQAGLLGVHRTVRAAARANGANRIAIVIPCHRVVGSDGKLTGYGGGLWRKRYLLDHERAHRAD